MDIKEDLEKLRDEIENCKKNAIKHIEKEEMVPATEYVLTMRDLKSQKLMLERLEQQNEI